MTDNVQLLSSDGKTFDVSRKAICISSYIKGLLDAHPDCTISCASCGQCKVYSDKGKPLANDNKDPTYKLLSFKKEQRGGSKRICHSHAPECALSLLKVPVSSTEVSVKHAGLLRGKPVASLSPCDTLWVFYPKGATLETLPLSLAVVSHSASDGTVVEISERVTFPENHHYGKFLGVIGGIAYITLGIGTDPANIYDVAHRMFALSLDTLDLECKTDVPTDWSEMEFSQMKYLATHSFNLRHGMSAVMDGQLILLNEKMDSRYDPETDAWVLREIPGNYGSRGPSEYEDFVTGVIGDTLYAICVNHVWAYTVRDGWTKKGYKVCPDRVMGSMLFPYNGHVVCDRNWRQSTWEVMSSIVSGRALVFPTISPEDSYINDLSLQREESPPDMETIVGPFVVYDTVSDEFRYMYGGGLPKDCRVLPTRSDRWEGPMAAVLPQGPKKHSKSYKRRQRPCSSLQCLGCDPMVVPLATAGDILERLAKRWW
ncbi:hypothetical protein KIPB_003903 [Kipferlia bialata]|uniref:Uncharacterized protein n=1 Tax=Kipferlia bialata TaxID=797122 RepID=A0A9K3CUL9_9EUKA|nr:hypothetical protein KIPB_003903 [Kipferlia bialata]|eukprot:g3903.t1